MLDDYFYRPFLAPLRSIITGEAVEDDVSIATLSMEKVLISRERVGETLKSLLTFLTFSPPFTFVAETLRRLEIPNILFELYFAACAVESDIEGIQDGRPSLQARKNASDTSVVKDWVADILRRIFAMKAELVAPVVLSCVLPAGEFSRQIHRSEWRGRFRVHSDCSVDIIARNDNHVHNQSSESPSQCLPVSFPSSMSADDMTSALTQTMFLQRWKQMLALVVVLEEAPPVAVEKRTTATDPRKPTTKVSTAALSAIEEQDTHSLTGSLSQVFLGCLSRYFALLDGDAADSPTQPETADVARSSTVQLIATALAVQVVLETVSMDKILVNGSLPFAFSLA